jgi:hypothetical protein
MLLESDSKAIIFNPHTMSERAKEREQIYYYNRGRSGDHKRKNEKHDVLSWWHKYLDEYFFCHSSDTKMRPSFLAHLITMRQRLTRS